jgi:hypothetical protein
MDVVAIGNINVLSCHGDKFVKNEKGKNDSIPHSIWANGIFLFLFWLEIGSWVTLKNNYHLFIYSYFWVIMRCIT